jgi:4,5-DOPA dioxygenase extradiol
VNRGTVDESCGESLAGDYQPLLEYEKLGKDADLSVPTPEHYLPLFYLLGTRPPGEPTTFPVVGIDGGSISMLAVQIGQPTTSGPKN